jgi:uncharacterized protein (DUF1501 family)
LNPRADAAPDPADCTRRRSLQALGAIGLASLAGAWPRAWAVASPAAAVEGRLVVLFLRGGLDGLFALAPTADPQWAALRPNLARRSLEGGLPLAGSGFSVDPSCQGLQSLYAAGELLFCPTAGLPMISRSHFQAQDVFELGTGAQRGEVGFLARLADELGATGPARGAVSFGRELPLSLRGGDKPGEVAPLTGSGLKLPSGRWLDAVRQAHAGQKTGDALTQALATQADIAATMDMDGAARGAAATTGFPHVAAQMGRFLKGNRRLCVAFMDLGGFDTHANQETLLTRVLQNVSDGLTALKDSLGPSEWRRTRVILSSEFGRTARENGTQGTDHGFGGLWLLAGGDIGGGRMLGSFAGLAPSQLHEGREVPVLSDSRELTANVLAQTFGLQAAALDRIFPGRPRTGLTL